MSDPRPGPDPTRGPDRTPGPDPTLGAEPEPAAVEPHPASRVPPPLGWAPGAPAPESSLPPAGSSVPPGASGVAPAGAGAGLAAAPPWWHAGRLRPGELERLLPFVGTVVLVGLPLGVVWWLLAPRREYLVSADGAFAVEAESEAAIGADGVLAALLTAVGIVVAILAWRRLPRGPWAASAACLSAGVCGVLAWQTGALLGAGPSAEDLADVGRTVLGPLGLRAYAVLVVAPFLAVLVYLLAACFTADDDLARPGSARAGPPTPSPPTPPVAPPTGPAAGADSALRGPGPTER